MRIIDFLFGISTAVAETTTTTTTEATTETTSSFLSILVSFAPMLLIFVVFYFFLIRPQRKKDKAVKKMLDNLKVGDRICTIGGIYGTISAIKDDTVTLTVGNKNTVMVIARWAIRSVEEIAIENDAKELN